jgi:hypothetical protein
MTKWHWILLLLAGYLLGYYFPGVGRATVGKLIPYNG